MRPVLIAFALASVGSAAVAGPFGLEMGTPAAKLHVIGRAEVPNTYRIVPPTPDAEFSSYVVMASPEHGLCKVLAIGRNHEADADGAAIRSAYQGVKAELSKQYGASGDFDFIDHGSAWSEPAHYAMSLHKNDRSLASFWDSSEDSRLPPDITNIKLEAKAESATATYVTATFEFENFEACSSAPPRADKSAL